MTSGCERSTIMGMWKFRLGKTGWARIFRNMELRISETAFGGFGGEGEKRVVITPSADDLQSKRRALYPQWNGDGGHSQRRPRCVVGGIAGCVESEGRRAGGRRTEEERVVVEDAAELPAYGGDMGEGCAILLV